jgi:imidazolonepropionase-like amidohydrolase
MAAGHRRSEEGLTMSAETTYAGIHVAQRPRRIALRADRLFDGVRIRDRAAPVLLFDGDTIVAVLEGEPPADTDVVDLPGTTVLPGLVDTHVHLAFDASADPVTAWPVGTARAYARR